MKFKFFFVTFLLLLCSCEKIIYQQILANREQDLKSRGGYESYLSLEYLDFSRRLTMVKDLDASEYFAKKGLDIMSGKTFIAEGFKNFF